MLAHMRHENTPHAAGRRLLKRLYRISGGKELPTIALASRGKPYFTNGNLHFSITHTPSHAFCVLSDCPVGIDAEEMNRRVDLRLAEKILSPREKAQYDAASDKPLALLKFWVLKEAAAKCTGEGLRGYPKHTDFSLDDPRVQEIDGCLVAIIKEKVGRGLAPAEQQFI